MRYEGSWPCRCQAKQCTPIVHLAGIQRCIFKVVGPYTSWQSSRAQAGDTSENPEFDHLLSKSYIYQSAWHHPMQTMNPSNTQVNNSYIQTLLDCHQTISASWLIPHLAHLVSTSYWDLDHWWHALSDLDHLGVLLDHLLPQLLLVLGTQFRGHAGDAGLQVEPRTCTKAR